MLKIAICCGEGFASGFLANKLTNDAKREGIDNLVSFTRIPFDDLYKHQDEFNIGMVLKHIEWKVKESSYPFKIPIYIIPYSAPAAPSVYDYIDDAQDILLIANGKGGVFRFPGEERTANVVRLMSYRKWWNQIGKAYHEQHPNDYISFIETSDDTTVERKPAADYKPSGSRLLPRQKEK